MLLDFNFQRLHWICRKSLLLLVLMTLVFTSCQKETTNTLEEKVIAPEENSLAAAKKLIAFIKEKKLVSKLDLIEKDHNYDNAAAKSRNSSSETDLLRKLMDNADFKAHRASFKQAINPDDYECGSTFINEYIGSTLEGLSDDEIDLLFNFSDFPLLEALLFDNTIGDDYFGMDGEYTSTLQKTFINLKTFWDIPTDIQLVDMHGNVFQNIPVVTQILELFFGNVDENGNFTPISKEEALEFAVFLQAVFGTDTFDNYNHPLFTFNAIAIEANPFFGFGKKIVMGDGIMEAYRANGYRTIAENFILAHEYGHHIQFANGYFTDEVGPEETRRTELMADAYAAYFMAHGKGLFIKTAIIKRFITQAYSIGDCAFDNPGHHGTPNQRAKAAAFGGKLAERKTFKDEKLSSQEFFELFEAALPDMIAPDAE